MVKILLLASFDKNYPFWTHAGTGTEYLKSLGDP